MKKKRAGLFLRRIALIFVAFIALALVVGMYHAIKPLPPGIGYEGEAHAIAASDIEFLYDLTYSDGSGSKVVEQEIFRRIFELVDGAEQLIVIDAFLFNDDYRGEERLIPITTILKEKLITKKQQRPNMTIAFITDDINNFYGSYRSDELQELEAANISVTVTDMKQLRDSNPAYSGFWRAYLQWFGTSGSGFLKHPLGNSEHKVTLSAFLKLLNTKANHRKVFITDSNDSLVTLVTSANPHEASSLHSNIAFVVKNDFLARDAFESEAAVARLSGASFPTLSPFKALEPPLAAESSFVVQLLTEGKIKQAMLRDIDGMEDGERIDLAMFYLSDRDVIKALKRAGERGVELRVILDPNKDAFSREKNGIPNRQVGFELMKAGIPVRWYDTRGEQFHTKLLVLHKKYLTIAYGGSANHTRRNLDNLNLESVVRIAAPPSSALVSRIESYFTRLWKNERGMYTLDFEAYKDTSRFRVLLYRFQEFSGFSSF